MLVACSRFVLFWLSTLGWRIENCSLKSLPIYKSLRLSSLNGAFEAILLRILQFQELRFQIWKNIVLSNDQFAWSLTDQFLALWNQRQFLNSAKSRRRHELSWQWVLKISDAVFLVFQTYRESSKTNRTHLDLVLIICLSTVQHRHKFIISRLAPTSFSNQLNQQTKRARHRLLKHHLAFWAWPNSSQLTAAHRNSSHKMSVLSKLLCLDYSLKFNCMELGHTWTPSCTEAGQFSIFCWLWKLKLLTEWIAQLIWFH